MKKTTYAIVATFCLLPILLMAAQIAGYLDIQVRASAPGSPASGWERIWIDTGGTSVHCKTSAGATCLFDSGASAHTIGMAFGESGGPALSTGSVFVPMSLTCTLGSTWYAYSDQTVTFDLKRSGTSLVSGTAPNAAGGGSSGSTSGWTTSISSGDVLEWKLLSVTSAPTTATFTVGCN